jgi:hypothetical protein
MTTKADGDAAPGWGSAMSAADPAASPQADQRGRSLGTEGATGEAWRRLSGHPWAATKTAPAWR